MTEKEEINYVSPSELIIKGYLQEANRQFFHPLGLALEVNRSKGVWQESLHIQDWRDDPEGVIFAPDVIDKEKMDNILSERQKRESFRRGLLGNVVQPLQIRPWLSPKISEE